MATPGRSHPRLAAALAIGAAALLAACTAASGSRPVSTHITRATAPGSSVRSASGTGDGTAGPPPATVAGGVPLGSVAPCVVATPAAWRQATTPLWTGRWEQHEPQAPAADGTGVFNQTDAGGRAEFAFLGHDGQALEQLGSLPHPAGAQYTFVAATTRWVAFVYVPTNGDAAQRLWSLYLYDRVRHQLLRVARYTADRAGHPLPSGWVRPYLTSDYLDWIQSTPNVNGWGGSEIEQYTLATGTTRVLYRGLTTALATYGRLVVFTALKPGLPRPTPAQASSQNPPMTVGAVDQDTGRPVTLPPGLTVGTDNPYAIDSFGDLLIWTTNGGGVRAWRPHWARSITILPALAAGWPPTVQYSLTGPTLPRLYRQFLLVGLGHVWALDLRTNTLAPLTAHPGVEDVTGSYVALGQNADDPIRTSAQGTRSDESVLNLAHVPDLPSAATCGGKH